MAAAVATGAAVLQPRVPSSSSSSAPVRRGRQGAASVRCAGMRGAAAARPAGGGVDKKAFHRLALQYHYRTLRLAPGATRGEVKKAFHRLALQYHPDVVGRRGGDGDDGCIVDFQRINVAYQRVMGSMREAEARLEYWRARYGLADEDLDRYRRYLNDDDDWFGSPTSDRVRRARGSTVNL